jgi:hypothetical protein
MDELIQALTEGKQLRKTSSKEPLIQFPYIWLERYPWQPGRSRIFDPSLNSEQKQQIETKLPERLLNAQVVNSRQLLELIEFLYARSQEDLLPEQCVPFSEAIAEDIKRRLIASETIMLIHSPWGVPYYALTHASYSPVDQEERTYTVIEDTSRYFRLMKDWADRKSITMRLMEELDILPNRIEPAMQELDEIIRDWADKYHHHQGQPMILHAVFGSQEESILPSCPKNTESRFDPTAST